MASKIIEKGLSQYKRAHINSVRHFLPKCLTKLGYLISHLKFESVLFKVKPEERPIAFEFLLVNLKLQLRLSLHASHIISTL